MNIERITLCNLTSIEGEQVIDFTVEPLRSAGLFAITGDTGAGKSTILDAICLALYNQAPRFEAAERVTRDTLDQSEAAPDLPPGDVRGILRRGQRQGSCSVIFSVPSGERYEAGWSLRVKRTGTYDRVVRILRCLSPHKEAIPSGEIPTRLPEIIGLDYTQFTRTVLLAQNSFANFLRAKRDEKSALLEKLTGTEIYGRISAAIHADTRRAEEALKEIDTYVRGALNQSLAPEELARLREEDSHLSAAAEMNRRRTEATKRHLAWYADDERLTAEVRSREEEHVAARKNYVSARAEELALERYDAVLSIQPLYQEIQLLRRQLDEGKQSENLVSEQIEQNRHALARSLSALDTAREQVNEVEERFAQRRPAINRGHVLNGEIGSLSGQLRDAEEQLRTADALVADRAKQFATVGEQIAATRAEIEKNSLHRQALSVHRMMFDRFDLVKDKLSALFTETRRNEESHKKFAALQKRQNELSLSIEEAEKKGHDDQARYSALRGELLIHQNLNHGYDSTHLQERFSTARNRLVVLERARALWSRISAGYEELEEKRAEIMRIGASREQMRKDMERLAVEVEVLDEAYRRRSVEFTLGQSENIKQLRQRLKEGTACPVCGATHHPYHTETERELGELLSGMEREYREAEQTLQAKRERLAALRDESASAEGRLTAELRNLDEREARQKADIEEWASCRDLDPSFADCSAGVARDARRLMIGLLIDNTTRAAEEAKRDLDAFNLHQGHINRLNEEIAKLDARMTADRGYLESLRTQYQVTKASAEETESVMRVSDCSFQQLYTDLDEMVTLSGWFAEWTRNADNFRMRLSALFNDWGHTCEQLDALQRNEAIMGEEQKAVEKALAEARRRAGQMLEARDALRERMGACREELKSLFGTSTPEREEEALQAAITRVRAAEVSVRVAHDDAQSRLNRLKGTRRSLEEARLQKQEQYSDRMSQLDLWMLRFNGDHSPIRFEELTQIFSDGRDWRALRSQLDALRSALALAENRLETARQALLDHQSIPDRPSQKDEETRPALLEQVEELTAEAGRITDRQSEVRSRLRSHEESVREASRYTARREAAARDLEEWQRLDALLGSADGKKFRQQAQSYTFRYLIEHANRHLRRLSPRYELQGLPGTLMLEVIDRDMFDQHRFVTSLSGGETFVVSLALALGLASLSGNGLSIGSLFIDEGFGNLDHASLDLVMTTLAHLENTQGRKVGIISHTEQIRSQISPQVRLVKLPGGGRSRIEIG